jgi:ABC-type multidrug transport system ATPase subunit
MSGNSTAVNDKGLSEYYRKSGRAQHNVRLEWKDITYRLVTYDAAITKEYQEKTILDKVSGHAESGQLLAILGPSGCGKTSLMNILAAKLPAGGSEYQSLAGTVTVNGGTRDEEGFRRASSYVLQDDFMYAHLTVLEVLTLASHFYCPDSMDDDDKAELVNAVIMELGLVKAKDTLIGNDRVRGVSGGERKRCNIGIQLITDPAILFLDEPTTGLDSFQALAVMECIKGLADNGRLVVAVIHQPRSQIYSMFDQMLLLSSGRTMYFGKAVSAVDYFEKAGYPCPEEFNPADHYLDILSVDNRSPELKVESENRISGLAQNWIDKIKATGGNLTSEASLEGGQVLMSSMAIGQEDTCGSFFMQLKHLCWRTKTEVIRDWFTLVVGSVIFMLMGLLIGGVYSNIGYSQISIQDRNGLLFFVGVNCTFNGLFSVLNVFPKEKSIVNVERANRAYNLTPYFLAKFFVEIPARVLPAVLYGVILYHTVGLREGGFSVFIGIILSVSVCSVALGMLVSAVMPTFEAAIGVGPLIVVVMILFAGFYIDINSLPEVANLVPYISILRWSFQALAINEYQGISFECEVGKKCLATGEQVLDSLGFEGKSVSYPISAVWLVCLFLTFSAYLILLRSKAEYSPLTFTGSKYVAIVDSISEKGTKATSTEGVELVPLSSEPTSD